MKINIKKNLNFKNILLFLVGISVLILIWLEILNLLGYKLNKKELSLESIVSPTVTQISATPTEAVKTSYKPILKATEPIKEPESSVNPQLISLELETAMNRNQDAMNALLTAVYNNTNGACSSIISQRTSQDHIYYMMKNFYDSKVRDYGQYQESIPGVHNSLSAFNNQLQIVRDRCASAGYQIY